MLNKLSLHIENYEFEYGFNILHELDLSIANFYYIKKVIDDLTKNESNSNFQFSIYLFSVKKRQDLVNKYFPKIHINLLSGNFFIMKNHEYHQSIKLDVNTDDYGDRKTWGSYYESATSNPDRFAWKLDLVKSVSTNEKSYFRIVNKAYSQSIKLDVNTDDYGDRQTWGSYYESATSNPDRFYWEIKLSFDYSDDLLDSRIMVVNKAYSQSIKLDINTDDYGDRQTWGGYYKNDSSNLDRFYWSFELF
nr:hypothetical protein [Xenorhabdus indica]